MNRNFDDAIVGFGGLTADSLDLAALELGMEAFPEEETDPEVPTINPLHDMNQLDFYLWLDEEVEKEAARRKAMKDAEA